MTSIVNELRLGNWLYGNDPLAMSNGTLGYFRVDAIEEDGINPWRMYEMDTEWSKGEAIPLTPEILEKEGFVRGKDYDSLETTVQQFELRTSRWHFRAKYVQWGDREVWVNDHYVPACQFLHQLQNLFYSLSGEELPITL